MSKTPRLPPAVRLIELPAHGTAVYVCPDRESYEGACRFFCQIPVSGCGGIVHKIVMTEKGWYFLLMGLFDVDDEELIAHECAHAAIWAWSIMGERYLDTDERNEPFCFLLGYLHKEVSRIVREARA